MPQAQGAVNTPWCPCDFTPQDGFGGAAIRVDKDFPMQNMWTGLVENAAYPQLGTTYSLLWTSLIRRNTTYCDF